MFKIHNHYGTERYFLIPPTGYLAKRTPHMIEATLLGKDMVEYFAYLKKTYPSVRLTKYSSFLSYSMNKKDAQKLMNKLNAKFKKVK